MGKQILLADIQFFLTSNLKSDIVYFKMNDFFYLNKSALLRYINFWFFFNERIFCNCPIKRNLDYSTNNFLVASRQIRRKIPAAGHLMTPRRLWWLVLLIVVYFFQRTYNCFIVINIICRLNKIPTQCDVVIEFPGIITMDW